MRTVLPLLLLLIFVACSGGDTKPAFTNYLEIRAVLDDDPLATVFKDEEGETLRLGDAVLHGRNVSRMQIKGGSDRYDLLLTLTGAEDARWRRFARSRVGKPAALVLDGRVRTVFNIVDPGQPEEDKLLVLTVPNVAQSPDGAQQLDTWLEANKPASKPAKREQ